MAYNPFVLPYPLLFFPPKLYDEWFRVHADCPIYSMYLPLTIFTVRQIYIGSTDARTTSGTDRRYGVDRHSTTSSRPGMLIVKVRSRDWICEPEARDMNMLKGAGEVPLEFIFKIELVLIVLTHACLS